MPSGINRFSYLSQADIELAGIVDDQKDYEQPLRELRELCKVVCE
jgi:hypothetical protein